MNNKIVNSLEEEFINTIFTSYLSVIELNENGKEGARSTKKVDILHQKIASDLNFLITKNPKLDNLFIVHSRLSNKTELNVTGAFYNKRVDIAIIDIQRKSHQVVSVLELKFPLSSYSKNKNNFIENSIGECANLRLADKDYYEVNIHFDKIPTFTSKDNFSSITGIDRVDVNTFDGLRKRSELVRRRKEVDAYSYAPNASLLLVLKSTPPLRGKTKKDYYLAEKENINVHRKNPMGAYVDRSLLKPLEWDPSVYINEYNDFLKKIIKDLERKVL